MRMVTRKAFSWLVALGILGAAILIAQNPVSISQVGTTAVTTTVPVSGTVAATQSGTWTVQPGNTANTTAWKVDGSAVIQPVSGTFWQATQPVSGTFWQATQPVSAASGTFASGSIASGAVASGAIASGAVASGAYASGSVSDGAVVTLGAKADAKSTATDTTAITIMSVLKEISFMAQTPAALPANQSTNVAQINGVTPLMGAGNTGTGSARVTIATDQAALAGVGAGATGAAPPANASYAGALASGATGGLLAGITSCDLSKVINISTATTTAMVTGVSGRQVRICAFHMITAAANNVAWIEGTGATCGTGTAGMAGGTTAASGYNFAANGGIAPGNGIGEVLTTATTGDSVCIVTSAATQLSGFIKYTIY